MFYLYVYENKLNGKMYIGQTIDLKSRYRRHRNGTDHKRMPIDKAIRKYGISQFNYWVVIATSTKEEIDQEEIFWIRNLREYLGDDMLYNITNGGDKNWYGVKHKEETKKILSEFQKKRFESNEARKIQSINQTGKKHSDVSRLKMSKSRAGKKRWPCSEETKRKISEAKKANK